MTKPVQILFSDDEFKQLEGKARLQGLTVPLFIKSLALHGDEFSSCYKKLMTRVDKLPPGTKFNIRMIFGTEWTMSTGTKLTLGKTYYNKVTDGTITNVRATGKDSSNVMWYVKL